MAPADTRCPRCGFAAADVWREQNFADRRVRAVVCRSCAFVFALTEPPVSSRYPLALLRVSDGPALPQLDQPDPLFVRAERSLAASREQRDELHERVRRAKQLMAAGKQQG